MGVSTRITRRNYSDYTIEEVFDVFKREIRALDMPMLLCYI